VLDAAKAILFHGSAYLTRDVVEAALCDIAARGGSEIALT
jgi:hypothetical protein